MVGGPPEWLLPHHSANIIPAIFGSSGSWGPGVAPIMGFALTRAATGPCPHLRTSPSSFSDISHGGGDGSEAPSRAPPRVTQFPLYVYLISYHEPSSLRWCTAAVNSHAEEGRCGRQSPTFG